jgi:regulator of RNase E activity RraA
MPEWKNDDELFRMIKQELFSAVVGDIMDKQGYMHQFLPPQIQPLDEKMFVVGRAMPVLEADTFGEQVPGTANELMNKSFGLMLEALDDLKKSEVYICTGASPRYALWGELTSTRAVKLGAAGAVVDGYARDTKGILRLFAMAVMHRTRDPGGKFWISGCPLKYRVLLYGPATLSLAILMGSVSYPGMMRWTSSAWP